MRDKIQKDIQYLRKLCKETQSGNAALVRAAYVRVVIRKINILFS